MSSLRFVYISICMCVSPNIAHVWSLDRICIEYVCTYVYTHIKSKSNFIAKVFILITLPPALIPSFCFSHAVSLLFCPWPWCLSFLSLACFPLSPLPISLTVALCFPTCHSCLHCHHTLILCILYPSLLLLLSFSLSHLCSSLFPVLGTCSLYRCLFLPVFLHPVSLSLFLLLSISLCLSLPISSLHPSISASYCPSDYICLYPDRDIHLKT